jgi:1-deoxy-D-xylulose-5-phosphate reductoisomerase
MVCAGNIINKVAKEHDTTIIPVDSEHSAIFQCCRGEKKNEIESITLTASGGPFRDWPIDKLKDVSAETAANHPNWSMGKKISIDSASMFNKGLEVIEANVLFGLEGQKINVLIHPQSIVHAFVNFNDGSTIAQMSRPDMISAIGFALNYPDRSYINVERMDLIKTGSLTFEEIYPAVYKNFAKDIEENLQIKFYSFIDENPSYAGNKGKLLWPLRAALSGKKASPGPFEIAEVFGKEKSIERLNQALKIIN